MEEMVRLLHFGGLVVNGLGALALALAQEARPSVQDMDNSGVVSSYVALVYPNCWRVGFWMLAAGFAMQAGAFFAR